jgi:AraC-like DNA-binding protein
MKPSFDTWTIIFLFAAVQGIFVSAVLLFKKDKHPARKLLAVVSFLFSLILIEYTLFWTHYDFYFPYVLGWGPCFIFLFGPLFYLYFRSAFGADHFTRKDLLHFIPFVLAVLKASPFLFASLQWKQDLMLKKISLDGDYFFLYEWTGIAHMLIYLTFILKQFNALSVIDKEVKAWFRWLTGFFMAFILSYASYFILSRFPFFNPSWDYAISFSMTFFIYFLAWFGYMQPKVFSGFSVFEKGGRHANSFNRENPTIAIERKHSAEEIKYKNSPVSKESGAGIAEQIQAIMVSQKLYLQSDLSLPKLSQACGFSKHYISQAINENMGMNFFEYVNSLRIEEAKALLKRSKEELTVIEIAYQVGYNNKVSFNKAFKNFTGLTPTEYRINHSGKPL